MTGFDSWDDAPLYSDADIETRELELAGSALVEDEPYDGDVFLRPGVVSEDHKPAIVVGDGVVLRYDSYEVERGLDGSTKVSYVWGGVLCTESFPPEHRFKCPRW